MTLFGVSEEHSFAKQLKRHIFGFPMKNWTISDQYFQRSHCQNRDIQNSAEFISAEQLQISFVKIDLRHPVEISLIENEIVCHF